MNDAFDEARFRSIAQQLRRSTRFQEMVRCEISPQQALDVVAMAHGYSSWAQLQGSMRNQQNSEPVESKAPAPAETLQAPVGAPVVHGDSAQSALHRVRKLICQPLDVWLGHSRAQGRTLWLDFGGHRFDIESISRAAAGTFPAELLGLLGEPADPQGSLAALCDALRQLVSEGGVATVPRTIEPLV